MDDTVATIKRDLRMSMCGHIRVEITLKGRRCNDVRADQSSLHGLCDLDGLAALLCHTPIVVLKRRKFLDFNFYFDRRMIFEEVDDVIKHIQFARKILGIHEHPRVTGAIKHQSRPRRDIGKNLARNSGVSVIPT